MPEELKRLIGNKRFVIGFAVLLALIWIMHDFVLVGGREFKIASSFSYENKTTREVTAAMMLESRKLVGSKRERDQILSFVHILECNRYLLYKKKVTRESFYDFLNTMLHPKQKRNLKEKAEYAYQVDKYLKRMRRTKYKSIGYNISEPEFYYEDFGRFAKVVLVRMNREFSDSPPPILQDVLGKMPFTPEVCRDYNEYSTIYFKKYKERFYIYMK
ncbi:MAG: hypothetical protein GY757_25740 [bacterium]|nr:hypothetical protein [bacterium]